MLILLGVYGLIGLFLAATWTGSAALRHSSGLASFLLVAVGWPLIILGFILAARHS